MIVDQILNCHPACMDERGCGDIHLTLPRLFRQGVSGDPAGRQRWCMSPSATAVRAQCLEKLVREHLTLITNLLTD